LRTLILVATLALAPVGSVAAQQEPPAAGRGAPAPVGNVESGRKLFSRYSCAACHGLEGQGAPTTGPRVAPDPMPFPAFARIVRTPPNQMPPYTEKVVSERELRDIYAFLQSRPRPAAPAVVPN